MRESRVFVYGSLCSGEPAHGRMCGAEFLGDAWTRPIYTLFDLGSYPGLKAMGETRVRGEIYRVSPERLRDLDRYEGHPDEFTRTRIALEGALTAEGYLWNGSESGFPVVVSGDWRTRFGG